jgi:hypothetical protein
MDRILPAGVVYRIQVGVFSRMVRPDYYMNISPVSAETDMMKGFIRYYTGFFNLYDDAEKALPLIQELGYKDAFIVAHHQEQKISLAKAKELENAPESTFEPIYRLQFGVFPNQLTEMSLAFYRAKTGDQRIQYLHNIKGEYVYTIGIFLTFEEAENAKDELQTKGLKDLEIVGLIGNEWISVEKR